MLVKDVMKENPVTIQSGVSVLEAFFQSRGNELLVGIRLIGEIAADKEEHRHVNLAYQLKEKSGIKPSNTHGERMSHHHHENSDALQQVEVFNSLFL